MLESLTIVARQVGVLFALMAVGFIANRLKVLKQEAVKPIVDIELLVVTPCVLLQAFQRDYDSHMLAGLMEALAVAVGLHLLCILFATLLVHTADKRQERVLRFAVVFSNAGFMGIPLQSALLGKDGVFYGAAIIAVFNLFVWSYGLVLMCGSVKEINPRMLFINPGTIGLAIGLPLFVFSLRLPPVINEATKYLSDLNTPLAMLVIGYYLGNAKLAAALRCPTAHLAMALRLVVVPLLTIGAFMLWRGIDPIMALAAVIAAAAPVAAMCTMFSAKFNQDTHLSVATVSLTTLLSILTMPLTVGLARALLMRR